MEIRTVLVNVDIRQANSDVLRYATDLATEHCSDAHRLVTGGRFCSHVALVRDDIMIDRDVGCPECIIAGDHWVHLRVCLICGHVGCCDDSKNRHARRHFERTGHAVIQSIEPDEAWRYCYVDDLWLGDGLPLWSPETARPPYQ